MRPGHRQTADRDELFPPARRTRPPALAEHFAEFVGVTGTRFWRGGRRVAKVAGIVDYVRHYDCRFCCHVPAEFVPASCRHLTDARPSALRSATRARRYRQVPVILIRRGASTEQPVSWGLPSENAYDTEVGASTPGRDALLLRLKVGTPGHGSPPSIMVTVRTARPSGWRQEAAVLRLSAFKVIILPRSVRGAAAVIHASRVLLKAQGH